MLVRHFSKGRAYRRLLMPLLRRVLWRALFGTHFRALAAMVRVSLHRALVWLPMKLKARRLGVALPMSLQVVDDLACRAGCSNCVFTAFSARKERLSHADLDRLFREALALNISSIYLMGADPFYRDDIDAHLDLLARHRNQLFFLFSEGKRISDAHLRRIRRAGNIIPVINIDGRQEATDRRKGDGSFALVDSLLCKLRDARMPYFVTTMVSRENHAEVTSPGFVDWLDERGAWLVAYVPYTPMDVKAEAELVVDAAGREALFDLSIALSQKAKRVVVLDMLGIEQHLTECPAAIYAITVYNDGTVTPCPAATFGRIDSNVHQRSLQDLFVNGELYKAIRALHAASKEPVHCLFYTEKKFFRDYIEQHRSEMRILNAGALEVLQPDSDPSVVIGLPSGHGGAR